MRLLKAHGIIPSMSGKGNCYDNAMVETVFKTICVSAWNKDPVLGVIGVQSGPPH